MRMGATLTLFEHETVPYEWDDHDLGALERLRISPGVAPIEATISAGNRALRASQYVGVARLARKTIQVLPKIYRSHFDASAEQHALDATRNLLFMLSYAMQMPTREQSLESLARQRLDWFETLTRLYARHLQEEWKRGPFRTYRAVDEEAPALRGKWRLDEQLRRPERKHRFSVTHDEFTADNSLNQILRYVVEHLWRATADVENHRLLGELRDWMDEVHLPRSAPTNDQMDAMINRLNERFRPLLNLARLFLAHQSQLLIAGAQVGFAFLFDMSRLFESFLTRFTLRRRADILPPALADCELLPQSRGAALYLAHSENTPVALLRPDLLLRAPTQQFTRIIDMKYKRLQPHERAYGVSRGDIFQMHAYAQRYNCDRVVMLYPQTVDLTTPITQTLTFTGTNQTLTVASVDLRGDLWKTAQQQELIERLRSVFS